MRGLQGRDPADLANQATASDGYYYVWSQNGRVGSGWTGWFFSENGVYTSYTSGIGYDLLGGRLLPGGEGPVAQFMYQDSQGHQRLALYVRVAAKDSGETAFLFLRQDQIGVFYWINGTFGYALSG